MSRTALHSHLTASILAAALAGTAMAQPLPAAPPVRDVTDTYFGVAGARSVPLHGRHEEPRSRGVDEGAGRLRERDARRKFPGATRFYTEIARRGDAVAARVFDVQWVGDEVYYQKRLANENIPKLYVRDGCRGQRAPARRSRVVKNARRHAQLARLLRAVARQPLCRLRHLARGIGGERAPRARRRHRQGAARHDRSRAVRESVVAAGRPPRLQPAAEARRRTRRSPTSTRTSASTSTGSATIPTATRRCSARACRRARKVEPVELVFASSVRPGRARSIAMAINGVQRELRVCVAPLAALDGAKTPWVKVADHADEVTDFAVQGDDLYLMTHKGAPRFKVLRTPLVAARHCRAPRSSCPPGEAVVTGIAAAQRRALRAKDERRQQRAVSACRARGSKLEQIASAVHRRHRAASTPIRGGRDAVFSSRRLDAMRGVSTPTIRRRASSSTRSCSRRGRTTTRRTWSRARSRSKAPDGTLIPLSIVHRKGLEARRQQPDDPLRLRRVRHLA